MIKKSWPTISSSARKAIEIALRFAYYEYASNFFFQLVRIGSKKSPPISRVNKHQYNNDKRVRRERSLLEIARGEGIRSAQLGKSSLRRNRAWWIHPLEFRCAESGERLLEERQPGAPCRVRSDDVWRVAVTNMRQHLRS